MLDPYEMKYVRGGRRNVPLIDNEVQEDNELSQYIGEIYSEWMKNDREAGKTTEEFLEDIDISHEKEILAKHGFNLEDLE